MFVAKMRGLQTRIGGGMDKSWVGEGRGGTLLLSVTLRQHLETEVV